MLAATVSAGDLPGPWTERVTAPGFGPLVDVAFGNSRFVAIGAGGLILQSQDAEHWDKLESGTTANLNAVTFTESNLFIAVGDNGTILTSSDGVAWRSTNPGGTNALACVSFGKGRYIASGTNSFLISSNAVDWTALETTNQFFTIAFGNGQFIAVGRTPYNNTLAHSLDGVNWTTLNPNIFPGNQRVQFLNGRFYLSGTFRYQGDEMWPHVYSTLAVSSDGALWTGRTLNGEAGGLAGVGFGNGAFIAIARGADLGFGRITPPSEYISVDGEEAVWTNVPAQSATAIVFGTGGIVPGDGIFVEVSATGAIRSRLAPPPPAPPRPDPFAPWNGRRIGDTNAAALTAIAACADGVVAVGTGVIASSPDGENWTIQNVRRINQNLPYPLTGVACGEYPQSSGNFVYLVGGYGVFGISHDAVNWTFTENADTGSGYYGGVSVSPKGLFRSTALGVERSDNGSDWTLVQPSKISGSSFPGKLELGNNLIVSENHGASVDGFVWQDMKKWAGSYLAQMLYADARFIGLGSDTALYQTQDGVTWGRLTNGLSFNAITYRDGRLFGFESNLSFKTSIDGQIWKTLSNPWGALAPAGTLPRAATVAFGTILVVGDQGIIVQSAPVSASPTLTAVLQAAGLKVYAWGKPGTYHLQRSTSLEGWENAGDVQITENVQAPISETAPEANAQFFRIVQ